MTTNALLVQQYATRDDPTFEEVLNAALATLGDVEIISVSLTIDGNFKLYALITYRQPS